MASLVGTPFAQRQSTRTCVVAALSAVGCLLFPLLGIPLALGAAAYAAIKWSRPDKILRGRTLSAAQHRRAAVVAAGAAAGTAVLGSALVGGFELAARLEQGLRDQVEIARLAGGIKIGARFEQCEGIACARATILRVATGRTLGVARLSGFAAHDESVYGWDRSLAAPVAAVVSEPR